MTDQVHHDQILTIFGIPVYGKYGLQLGLLVLATWTIVYVLIGYVSSKRSPNKATVSSPSAEERQVRQDEFRGLWSEFHENGKPPGVLTEETGPTVPLQWEQFSENRMLQKSKEFYEVMNRRRSVRTFSTEKMPRKIIENIIYTAGTSPSGANQQPWTFVLVEDHETKASIRKIIEAEEELNYKRRMGERWVKALRHLNTNWIKPYLTDAPYVLVVFKQLYAINKDGNKQTHYYSELSVAIATGILFAAIHNAGLVSTVSTPMNCGRSVAKILQRPPEERLLFVMPIGYPAMDCTVPAIKRKNLENIYIHI